VIHSVRIYVNSHNIKIIRSVALCGNKLHGNVFWQLSVKNSASFVSCYALFEVILTKMKEVDTANVKCWVELDVTAIRV
jgi:hypothetical protein